MSRKPSAKKAKKKKAPLPIVPPLGPPQNLRPGGTHADRRRAERAVEERAAIREEMDGF